MELEEYRKKVLEDIRFNSAIDGTNNNEEFIKYVSGLLNEAEEIDDEIVVLPFEGTGKSRKKIQIDGYFYNELDDCLSIYIVPSLSFKEMKILSVAESKKYFSKAIAFIENADFIIQNAEESAPAYGFAIDIIKLYKGVRRYQIYILTESIMSNNLHKTEVSLLNGKDVEYHIWDINRLFLLENSKNGKENIVINLEEFNKIGIACLPASITEDYTAYLCNISGRLLADLYNQYGGRLLEGNVRSFLQTRGKVNKGIRNTILNEPEMFFAYNNGIAATASSMKQKIVSGVTYITEITDLQIVNGGQTTASLASALINDKKDGSEDNIEKIYVPMKLSIVSIEKGQELIPNISRYANSQNKVSDTDFWSNDPFHIRIEDLSRRLIAPAINGQQYGTYWYYERARGQYKQGSYKLSKRKKDEYDKKYPKKQMFTKTDLAKYMNVYLELPWIASTGGQKSFAKFAQWAKKEWDKNDLIFNEEFFKKVVSIAIIFKTTDSIVRHLQWYNSYKANIVEYTISKIIYTVKKEYPTQTIDYNEIWKKQELSKSWLDQITYLSKEMYEVLIEENRLVENVTEWAKKEACWDRAKKVKIKIIPEFEKELIDIFNVSETVENAKKQQKEDKYINSLVEVCNYGVINWKKLLNWNSSHNILSSKDKDLVNVAINIGRKNPSDIQCKMIIGILDKAILSGFSK